MAKLRVEFTSVGAGRGRLGGQVDVRAGDPLGSVTLDVTATPTASGDRPSVPTGAGTVFAELSAADAPIYVDIGGSPDPSGEPRLLVLPGHPQLVHVGPGQTVSAILAADVPSPSPGIQAAALTDRSGTVTAGGIAQQACAANAGRKLLLVANPDETRTLWFSATGTASAGPGGIQVGPGGAFVFDRVVPSGAVSILGPSAGQPFTVKEA